MTDAVRFEIRGLPELQRALLALVDESLPRVERGFIARASLRGQSGGPHTLETIELVGRQRGFEVRGA